MTDNDHFVKPGVLDLRYRGSHAIGNSDNSQIPGCGAVAGQVHGKDTQLRGLPMQFVDGEFPAIR